MAYAIYMVCIVITCSITIGYIVQSNSPQLAKDHLLWFLSNDTSFPEKDSTSSVVLVVVFAVVHIIPALEDLIMNFMYLVYTTVFFDIVWGFYVSTDLESRKVVPLRITHHRLIQKCVIKFNRVYGSALSISVINDMLNLSLLLIPRLHQTVSLMSNLLYVGIKVPRYILAGMFSNKVKKTLITYYY